MKFSEMCAARAGLPEGFSGMRCKWTEVKEDFEIEKIAILQKPALNEEGEPILYSKGDRAGSPVMDRQTVLQIRTVTGRVLLVRTNSRRISGIFAAGLGTKRADGKNVFGDEFFVVEAPEGKLRFVPFRMEYSGGLKGDIADLEEAEE